MRVIKWTNENIKEQLTNLLEVFDNHVNSNRERYKQNEDAYRDRYYDRSLDSIHTIAQAFNTPEEKDEWLVKASMNHSFTFIRLLHSMLMSNEPMVTASPANTSQESRDSSVVADYAIRYSRVQYKIKEHVDYFILHGLIYGMGCLRATWNETLGDLIDAEELPSGDIEVTFEGDNELRSVLPYNYALYSTDDTLNKVYGYLERIYMDIKEAKALYPEFSEQFTAVDNLFQYDAVVGENKQLKNKTEIFEYFEEARPFNGGQGRYVRFLRNYTVLKKGANPIPSKKLPVALFADIVCPGSLYPLGILDMLRQPQKHLNELMSRFLENAKLFTKIFVAVDRNANLNKDAFTDKPYVVSEYSGTEGRPPTVMNTPTLPAFSFKLYDMLVEMMQHIAGLRDFSRGQMPKAVSGFTANLMIEADNKVHIQVHERYKSAVKTIFELLISNIHENWTEEKTINITGIDNNVEVKKFKGSDLDGGYNVVVDYGTTLPVDPAARRQMIQELVTMAQNMGVKVEPNRVLELMKMGDLLGTYDMKKDAQKRQREEYEIMGETKLVIPADFDSDDHVEHYTELFRYFQTKEYDMLETDVKALLKQHANQHLEFMGDQQKFPGMSYEQVQQAKVQLANQPPMPAMPPQQPQQNANGTPPAQGAIPTA